MPKSGSVGGFAIFRRRVAVSSYTEPMSHVGNHGSFTLHFYSQIPEHLRAPIIELLTEADEEFVPPLSSRTSTTQVFGDGERSAAQVGEGVEPYFEGLTGQSLIACTDDGGTLAGLMSFRPGFEHESFLANPSAYISTIIVRKSQRRQGLTMAMYGTILDPDFVTKAAPQAGSVSTRTWSSNTDHLGILERLGFELVEEIPNDRGPGIATLYFEKLLPVESPEGDVHAQ